MLCESTAIALKVDCAELDEAEACQAATSKREVRAVHHGRGQVDVILVAKGGGFRQEELLAVVRQVLG
jgi:hypothetical protein